MDILLEMAPRLVFPIVMIALVGASLFYGAKRRQQFKQDQAHFQVGALAQQLGMRVERGQPQFNLFVPDRHASETQHVDVLMRGERGGVPVELVYYREVTRRENLSGVRVDRKWQAEFTARTQANFGHFEVTMRAPESYAKVRPFFEQAMPDLQTGDPRVDSVLRLTGDNPAIAAPLGALLLPLISLHYVHVVGAPGTVKFLMSHGDLGRGQEMMGVSMSLPHAALILDVLCSIVRTAEG